MTDHKRLVAKNGLPRQEKPKRGRACVKRKRERGWRDLLKSKKREVGGGDTIGKHWGSENPLPSTTLKQVKKRGQDWDRIRYSIVKGQ